MHCVLFPRFDFDRDEASALAAALRAAHPELTVHADPDRVPLAEVEIGIGFPDDSQLAAMVGLRWLQVPSAGTDGWLRKLADRPQVLLSSASGVYGVAAAEQALALLLALGRRIPRHVEQQRAQRWAKIADADELEGRTAVILGLGDIGRAIAVRLAAFGVTVIGVNRGGGAAPPGVSRVVTQDAVDEVLPQAGILALALPHTPATTGVMSAGRLAALPAGALLVNVGRGSSLDQEALVALLRSGHLAGAGLDVTDPEPLPAGHPLWALPNVVITSHSVNASPGKARRRQAVFLANVARFLRGEPPHTLADRSRGY